MPPNFDDAQRWRALAEEAITSARQMAEPEPKRLMLFIADAYKRLAERARARKNQNDKNAHRSIRGTRRGAGC